MKGILSKQKLFIIALIGIVVVSLSLIGTFAYQTVIMDNVSGSIDDFSVAGGVLDVNFTVNNRINLSNMPLLEDYTKSNNYSEFTINNSNSTENAVYRLKLVDLECSDSLKTSDFKYTILEGNTIVGEGDFSDLDGDEYILTFNSINNIEVDKGSSRTFKLYLWLKETSENQNSLENTSFKGKIQIESYFESQAKNMNLSKLIVKGNNSTRALPNEYQQVDYIESTGTQYIDLGYVPKTNTKIETYFKFDSEYDNTKPTSIFGVSDGTDTIFTTNFGGSSGDYKIMYNWVTSYQGPTTGSTVYRSINSNYNQIQKFVMEPGEKVIWGDTLSSNALPAKPNDNISYMYLFARNNVASNTINIFGAHKMYVYNYFKIYEGDTLVRNYIPCYRISDGAVGLYDTVTNAFFGNSGTGEFIKGTDIYSDGNKTYNLFDINWLSIYTNHYSINSTNNYIDISGYANSAINCENFLTKTGLTVGDTMTVLRDYEIISGSCSGGCNHIALVQKVSSLSWTSLIGGKTRLKTYTITDNFNNTNYHGIYFYGSTDGIIRFKNVMFVKGSYTNIDDIPYEPYGYKINVNGDSVNGITSGNLFIDGPLYGIDGVYDYYDAVNNKIIKRIGVIDSYNGETITGKYVSSTGELTTGAKVYYVLDSEEEVDNNISNNITYGYIKTDTSNINSNVQLSI